jgi:hypothetical protein
MGYQISGTLGSMSPSAYHYREGREYALNKRRLF